MARKLPDQPQRVALYARVSTLDKGQDPETQLRPLRAYAHRRGFETTGEYIDTASGKTEDRTQYKLMLAAARKRSIDVVLVWRYDRFARSTQALVNALKEFQSLGVDFISYQENIDTTTPTGELIFHVMASLAQFESWVRLQNRAARAAPIIPHSVSDLLSMINFTLLGHISFKLVID